MKLEENMYVRTKYGISQYKYYDTSSGKLLCIPVKDGSRGIFANIEDIIKASFNIIDLVEVGDYVNGYKVHKIGNCLTIILDTEEHISWINPDEIKSIVTHQQMEQISYKVGDNK